METVAVLLSTYNGEKYLKEQIDSILNQIGLNVCVFARDDGSKDSTVNILKEYSENYSNFSYYCGLNVGPAQSFFELIKQSPNSDYYAFADQDDVWDQNKLECAVKMLSKKDASIPQLYYSNLRIVDQDLKYYRMSHQKPYIHKKRYSALAEGCATGCTIVINTVARDFLKDKLPSECTMHDNWIYMVCKLFGEVNYDFEGHISYRQHGGNVIGTYLGKKNAKTYIKRFKRLFNRNLQPRYKNAISFWNAYGDLLNADDRKKVLEIVHYKNSFINRCKLLFDFDIGYEVRSRDIRYRILIILGLI